MTLADIEETVECTTEDENPPHPRTESQVRADILPLAHPLR